MFSMFRQILLMCIECKDHCLCSFHLFFFSSRRRHTRFDCDWSSDVCSSDLDVRAAGGCTDTDNNSTDFTATTPNPRNTSTAFNVCGGTPTPTPTPSLSINDVSQAEGDAGTTNFVFTVSLSSPAQAGGVSFTVNTADGTTNPATAGSDYVAITNGAGSIAQGHTDRKSTRLNSSHSQISYAVFCL